MIIAKALMGDRPITLKFEPDGDDLLLEVWPDKQSYFFFRLDAENARELAAALAQELKPSPKITWDRGKK